MRFSIIIMCVMKLWSIEVGKGAPSFFNTVKGYLDSGWDTYLINPDTEEDLLKNNLIGLKHAKIEQYHYLQPENKIGKWFYNNRAQTYYNAEFKKALNMIIHNFDPTRCIIYAYEVAAVPMAKVFSKKYNIKLVTRFQGTILFNKSNNLINRIAYNHHYFALTTKSDLVIMTNDGTNGDKVLKQLGNFSPAVFWRNGVDRPIDTESNAYSLEGLTGHKSLLTVSRLVSWKRVDRAIKAMSDIVKRFPSCMLYIIGDGPERDNLKELAENLNVSDNIIFLGSIIHEQVYQYMKNVDIFLSLYDLSNLGNPLFEAMMCGKPIITINNGDTASVINNNVNGILLEVNEADNCSSYVISLLENELLMKKLGSAAKKFADENFWTWDKRISEEILKVGKLLQSD